ncbi:MAG: response regulator [Motiliproteus sp.]|nr:response regulator [Motiliproteus sp.]MCW9053921.1 response regulator [Motiliproteus sp.]
MPSLEISELSILIVEPSSFQQKVIRQELEQSGCNEIDTAKSIEEALVHLERYSADLVVSAMYLPDGDGVELVSQMRSSEALGEIPFMLISSEQRPDHIDPIKQAGSVAILPKPFCHADLEKALEATLAFIDPEELNLDSYNVEALQVLVVDDSDFSLKHIARALENIGVQKIIMAHDGKEALAKIEEYEFDLIFTDFNMPNMDGEQLTQHIREHSSQPYVPILMVTSEQNETRLNGVKRAGVNAICDKPFSPDHMKSLMVNLLS